jgi:hypothetical protein
VVSYRDFAPRYGRWLTWPRHCFESWVKSISSFGVVFLVVLPLAGLAYAQDAPEARTIRSNDERGGGDALEEVLTLPIPHPFLLLGPSLMGGGYAPFAYRVEGGIDVESSYAIVRASGAYDNGRKVNDNDQPNSNGHDRYLDGAAYFRLNRTGRFQGLYFGAGYTWSQLSTTNYTKGGGRYQVGGGYDLFLRSCKECRRDYSMRINVDWLTAGHDWQNGSHGPKASITIPSPREKRHWFYNQNVGIYRFHETVTEPTNLPLVQLQQSQRYFDCFADFGVLYRF